MKTWWSGDVEMGRSQTPGVDFSEEGEEMMFGVRQTRKVPAKKSW